MGRATIALLKINHPLAIQARAELIEEGDLAAKEVGNPMSLLHLDSLPPRATKGDVLHLLCAVGGLVRAQVGRIELYGAAAVVEVPEGWEARLTKTLDGVDLKGRRLRVRAGGVNSYAGPDDHFGRLARLVRLESEAEAKEALEKSRRLTGAEAEATGDCLVGLVMSEEASGLGGRWILTLTKRDRSRALPFNRLEPGAPVLLMPEGIKQDAGCRGVVCERSRTSLSVAFQ